MCIPLTPESYPPKWAHGIDSGKQGVYPEIVRFILKSGTCTTITKYVSGRMCDYDYGQSLLGKRPYLVTGLQPREVRTDAILGGAVIDCHPGPCVI